MKQDRGDLMKISNDSNILPFLEVVSSSMPENVSSLEKLRYIYIELGKLLSYDYRIIRDQNVIHNTVDYSSGYVGRYQSCYQISEILSDFINKNLPNASAKVVERVRPGIRYANEHVATEVTLTDEDLTLLLDLTLDLANIQSKMKTKHFGFEEGGKNYDIIPLNQCRQIDKKIGFITENYTDDQFDDFKEKLDQMDFGNLSQEEIVDYKIRLINDAFSKSFIGHHEATTYIYLLLKNLLSEPKAQNLKQYNLTHCENDEINIISIFSFYDLNLYYMYSNELGFKPTNPNIIQNLLNNSWQTNSKSIQSLFTQDENIKMEHK